MPEWLWAGVWGFVAGSALLAGAAAGVLIAFGKRTIAALMAFGSGVLISALSFDLMAEAYRRGGFDSTSAGSLVALWCTPLRTGCFPAMPRGSGKARAISNRRNKSSPAAEWRSQLARFWTASRNRSSLGSARSAAGQ
jgi:hypothetical protein